MKKKKLMIIKLNELLKKHNARLLTFEYFAKIFGNIIIEIKFEEKKHKFISDRGDIYYNSKFICDGSYYEKGKNDAFDKLLEIIEQQLFI